ncbi:FecR domain-containing protein [Caballeronia sp. NK8]|uniref:FecR family protein n=1 Tax=Caballeronia sp. NK8 TaxID=140098 RepID=UPI001BB6B798|nr:FecR family protein [Caballeronia sp. NK8]BCQ23346.1 FecR domain-containing protein [Caballeronia sp. NK8]
MMRARHVLLLLLVLLAMTTRAASAEPVATITALVGNVAIQSAGGAQRVAAVGGGIDNGDTVQTGVASEIVMIFTDKQRVYLKPGSVFRVDDFHYAANTPQEDRSFLSLVKGGLRAVDGLVAKEGKPENYRVKTPTSTIGIRGTEYSVTDCANLEPGGNADCKGDQIVVYDGQIVVINQVDRQIVRAGEGAIVISARLPFGVLPASRVTPVVPSAACR